MESRHKEVIQNKLAAVIEAIDIIQQRSEKYTDVHQMLSSYDGSIVFDSCVMRIQTIGENIRAIDSRTNGGYLSQYHSQPWAKIIGLRNIISHEYANVDPEIIWTIITRHLAPLKETVLQMLREL